VNISKLASWLVHLRNETFSNLYHLSKGIRAFLEHRANEKKIWDPKLSSSSDLATSISDSLPYADFCHLAAIDPKVFLHFKSAAPYKQILEHTGLKNGLHYAGQLRRRGIEPSMTFLTTHTNIGSPEVFSIKDFGYLSPSLLRYFRVASDLEILFPEVREQSIIEIGVGYGGQLCVLRETGFTGNYTGVDLPGAIKLTAKYLDSVNATSSVELLDGTRNESPRSASLCISNYAFCELGPEIQESYLQNYILNCSRGYVTWNTLSEQHLGGMTAEQFARRVDGVVVLDPMPTYSENLLVVWGSSSSGIESLKQSL
jgi:hypothetical protein